ncbi:hypothetical protein ABZV81_30560 [Streptomyces parvus]
MAAWRVARAGEPDAFEARRREATPAATCAHNGRADMHLKPIRT